MSPDTPSNDPHRAALREKIIQDRELEAHAKDLAEQISRFVNKMSGGRDNARALGKAMLNDHRTLLQTKMLIVLEFLDGLAMDYQDGRFDARNERACKLAASMMGSLSSEDREYIPYI